MQASGPGTGPGAPGELPVFVERPTGPVVRDGLRLAAVPAAAGVLAVLTGHGLVALGLLGLAGGLVAFFRNPERVPAGDELSAVSPADGRVISVAEALDGDGEKRLRIGVYLSLLDVHVTRAPVAGRVVAVERHGGGHHPAFIPDAERVSPACAMTLETPRGERVRVVQITGVLARRIVCHPRVGEWVARGARYGLIRFGSRTDVVLPPGARARVQPGDRVRGGSSVIATLPEAA